jgi:hypothetical protein
MVNSYVDEVEKEVALFLGSTVSDHEGVNQHNGLWAAFLSASSPKTCM